MVEAIRLSFTVETSINDAPYHRWKGDSRS